jgi:hypothetical protein
MNRSYILRRAAAATAIVVTAAVVTVAGASPAHAEGNAVCDEYRYMSWISWGQYFAEIDQSWNTDILGAARMVTTARYWDDRVVDTCY